MNVLVTTCDKNMHLLPGFAHLFNKYWGGHQHVTILGYAAPDFDLPANFEYFSLGAQENYPMQKWSDALIAFLNHHPAWDTFVLLLEDYWLVRPVNLQQVITLYHYMRGHRDVIKMDLCAERLYASGSRDFAYWHDLDLLISDPSSMYHWSWWPGIWNREPLSRVLIPGESCHDHELYGSARLGSHDDIKVLGTRQYPLRNISVYKYDEPGHVRLEGLRETDIRELDALGYLPGGGSHD